LKHSVKSNETCAFLLSSSQGRDQGSTVGGPRATSDPTPLVNKSEKLFVNLLPVTTSSFIWLAPKDLKKVIVVVASSAALRTSASQANDVKTYSKMQVSDKNCVRYKMMHEKI
jgi:hypothetical protein